MSMCTRPVYNRILVIDIYSELSYFFYILCPSHHSVRLRSFTFLCLQIGFTFSSIPNPKSSIPNICYFGQILISPLCGLSPRTAEAATYSEESSNSLLFQLERFIRFGHVEKKDQNSASIS